MRRPFRSSVSILIVPQFHPVETKTRRKERKKKKKYDRSSRKAAEIESERKSRRDRDILGTVRDPVSYRETFACSGTVLINPRTALLPNKFRTVPNN